MRKKFSTLMISFSIVVVITLFAACSQIGGETSFSDAQTATSVDVADSGSNPTQDSVTPLPTTAKRDEQTGGNDSSIQPDNLETPTPEPTPGMLEHSDVMVSLGKLDDGKPSFIYFSSADCQSCQTMIAVIDELKQDFSPEISFISLDSEHPANEQLKKYLGYRYDPQYFLVNGKGEILAQWLGLVRFEDFYSEIVDVLAEG